MNGDDRGNRWCEKGADLCLLADDLGRDDLLAVDVVLDVNLLCQKKCTRDQCHFEMSVKQRFVRQIASSRCNRGVGGTYVTAGLDVDLVDLARLDVAAERSVCAETTKQKTQRDGCQQLSIRIASVCVSREQTALLGRDLHSITSPTTKKAIVNDVAKKIRKGRDRVC